MTAITLESLGLSKEQVAERIIDAAVENLLHSKHTDEEGDAYVDASDFQRKIQAIIVTKIDAAVSRVADENVAPRVNEMIETLVIQSTNQWGEKKGEPVTFIEYLTQRAEAWIAEQVDHNGKTKAEESYNWRPNTSRIAYMIDRHLQYSIKTAMENALKEANASMAKALHEACRVAINNVAANFAVVAKAGK